MSIRRAQGCLLGQIAGDSLGSLVEFMSPKEILEEYPDGVRYLEDGGVWDTIAGQPTDDSEMALALARCLLETGRFDVDSVRKSYTEWLNSDPFDIGNTTRLGLTERPDANSQANGALMRISPLGIFCTHIDTEIAWNWASEDSSITHPHHVCRQANSIFTAGIACAIREEMDASALFEWMSKTAHQNAVDDTLLQCIEAARTNAPETAGEKQGWVLIAFQNALWQLLHAPSFEDGVVDTVMRGGDTDTNAAICGALLGAACGLDAVPAQWKENILSCRPAAGDPRVKQPRPKTYWPADATDLALSLLESGNRLGLKFK